MAALPARHPRRPTSLVHLSAATVKNSRSAAFADGRSSILVRRAIALNGTFAAARGLLGKILYQRGKLAEALPELERAVRLRPGFSPARIRLAKAYQELGRAEDAAREFAFIRKLKAEERQPVPALLYHRGRKAP